MARRLLLLTLWLSVLSAGAPATSAAQRASSSPRDATAPLALSAASLDFGAQRVAMSGTVQMLTLTDTMTATLTITSVAVGGADAADFAVTDSCAGQTLQPQAACGIGVGFTPAAAGNRSATLLIADDAPGAPQSVALTGIGAMPSLSVSANSLDFGTQAVDTSGAPQQLTLTNSGLVTLTITTTVITGTNPADFDETDTCVGAVLPPQGTCGVSLTFSPQDAGSRGASLLLIDDASDSPQSIALSGNGSDAGVSVSPGSIDFGDQQAGGSASRSVTVANNGAASLSIDGVTVSGDGDFAETDTCSGATLPAGSSCTLNVTFTPQSGGPSSGSVILLDDAPDSPQVISVSGNGVGFPTPTPTATYTPTAALSGTATITATPPLSASVALSATVTVTPTATPTPSTPTPTASARRASRHHTHGARHAVRRTHPSRRHVPARSRGKRQGSVVRRGLRLLLSPGRAVVLTIDVHTRPHAGFSVTVRVTTREASRGGSPGHRRVSMRDVMRFQETIDGVADAHGHYRGRVYVAYRSPRTEWADVTISERINPLRARPSASRSSAHRTATPAHTTLHLRSRTSTRRLTVRLTPGRAVALLVGLRTTPRWRVAITVEVLTRESVTVGAGRHRHRTTRLLPRFRTVLRGAADARGAFSGRVWITYRSPRPEQATVLIRSLATPP